MVKFLEYQDLAQYNCLLDRLDSGDCYVFGKIEVYSCKRTTQDKKLSREIAQRNNITNNVHDSSFNSDITGSPPLSPSRHSDEDSDDENNNVNSGGVSPSQSTSRPQSIPLRQNAFLSQRFQQLHNQQHNQQQQTTIAGSFEDQFQQQQQQQHFSPSSGSGGLSPLLHHRQQQQHALGPLSNAANLNTLTLFISVLNALYQDYDFRSANPEHFAREPSMEYVYNSINLSLSDALSHLNRNNLWESIDRIIDIRSCEIYSYRPDDDDDGDPLALAGGKVWSWNYFFYNRKQKKILYFACYAKSKMSFSLHRPYTHDGRSISASSGMGSADNVYASFSSSRYDSYGGDYGYGDDDDDEMEYRSNPKNQYFHTYPRGTGGDGDDDYAISYNHDDDDDDEMMFDDLL